MACRPANKLAFKTWHEDVLFWKELLCIQTNFLTTLATFVSSFPTAKTWSPSYCVRIMTRQSGCTKDEIIPTMPSLEISIGEGWGRQRSAGLQDDENASSRIPPIGNMHSCILGSTTNQWKYLKFTLLDHSEICQRKPLYLPPSAHSLTSW